MGRKKKLGAGYRLRNDGRIEYRWTQGENRYSVTGSSIEECKEKEIKKRAEIERKQYVKNADITLEKYFEEFQHNREGTVKESNLMREKSTFKAISEDMGKMKLCEIEKRQVQQLQDKLKEKYTTNYTNGIMALLSFIMRTAIEEEIITKNPCTGVKKLRRTEPPARETIHRALSQKEVEKFFKAAEQYNSWYYDLYDFLVNTGLRIGEAGALLRSDIDSKNNVIHIRRTITNTEAGLVIGDSTKTKSGDRVIPMNDSIKAILQRQEQRNRMIEGNVTSINGIVFRSLKNGMIDNQVIRRDITAILKRTDIEYFSVHAFRDTFATRALEAGMNPRTLQEILGHSSFAMTMDLYGHVMQETKQKEMNLINFKTGTR